MNFSENFPILKSCTYLNTAYSGLLSKEIAQWRQQHDAEFMQGGSNFRINATAVINELRQNLSATFAIKMSNVFLTPNFSIAFHNILDGLEKDHRFLLLQEDYPSLNYPVKSKGFQFLEVPINASLEQNIIDGIESFKPSVFAFSMVQYINGIKMDINFIRKLKANFPDLILIADGTQFLGTETFDFEHSGLDALVGSGYKWLLGGYGNGYIFLSDELKEVLFSTEQNADLPNAPFAVGRDALSLRLEPGHLDSLSFGTLNQGIHYLNSIGLANVANTNAALSGKARVALHAKGLIPDWIMERTAQSSIINIPLSQAMNTNLEKENILCAARGSGTRIAFHFYNTEEDLNRFLALIK